MYYKQTSALKNQSNGTVPGQRSTRAAHTLIILSIIGVDASWEPLQLLFKKSIGRIPFKIVYFLRSKPITCSTCMRTLAIPLVPSTSTGSSWSLLCVKAGIATSAFLKIRDCWMVNQWSAKTWSAKTRSPGSSFSNRPHCSIKHLSQVLPPHAFETKEFVPCEVMPIKTFTVLWCL